MDYLAHFNLSEEPFRLTPDPFYFYPSRAHSDALASLNYAIEQREGFSLVVGEPGTGKTTLVRVFVDAWKNKAEIALVMTPHLSPSEFLAAVLDDLKIKPRSKNKNDLIKAFRTALVDHSSANRPVVIIVDEAQDMPDETLEELRLLSNLETDTEKLLQIILVGQPELKKRLQSEGLKQLDQRVSVRSSLRPLTALETEDYINLRLIRAGKGNVIFDDHAKTALYRSSGGTPRLINLLASRSIMAAYIQGNDVVGRINVLQAKRHLWDKGSFFESFRKRMFQAMVGTAAAVALSVTVCLLSRDASSHPDRGPLKQTQALPQKTAQPSLAKYAVVLRSGAYLRALPRLDAPVIGEASGGANLQIIDETRDVKGRRWYNVGREAKENKWLSQHVVKIRTAAK